MNAQIQLFLFLLTGVTIAFSAVNLIIAFQKGSVKSYLFLGIMGICVGIYNMLFSIAIDAQPDNSITKLALMFFLANFGIMPWFLSYYTNYYRPKFQWFLTIGMAISFIVLVLTSNFTKSLIWNILAHFILIGIIVFGFKASAYQYKKGGVKSSILLFSALLILSILTVDDIVRTHFTTYYPFDVPANILPLDYFLVLFMIIMGLKLARDMHEKYKLEKSLNLQQNRWSNLLENLQLLVVGVDRNEKINYANSYFFTLTGFNQEEILGHHYMNLIPEDEIESITDLVLSINDPNDLPFYQNNILTKNGDELAIGWSLVGMYDEKDELISSISIGVNITEQVKAFEEIKLLKSKLEEENIILKTELGKIPADDVITGRSDAIRYVLQRVQQVAASDTTVLIEGETGVGKELVAKQIKENSNRPDKPFIKLNCAAIPSTLLESELFGHAKGAFTGADKHKKGMAELADGGTLLLDEIGEFPLDLQPKLLRFLQELEFVPLGSEKAKKVDVRIIAATNKILLKEVERGKFRNDLYYRLYVYPITVPPLRNRTEDIQELVDVFVKRFAIKHQKPIKNVSRLVVEEFLKYSWPGNIRELENIVEHAVIVSTSDTIKMKDITHVFDYKSKEAANSKKEKLTLEEVERNHIIKILLECKWRVHGQNGAAEVLNINPSTLRSRMKKLNISKP